MRDARERAEEVLELIGMQHRRNSQAGLLTYAEQRALEIGITIAGGAEVILLDEPTAGMSRSESDHAVELIRKVTVGKTLVMVEHDMSVVFGLADRISVLVYGEVIATDTPRGHPQQPQGQGSLPGHEPRRTRAGRSALMAKRMLDVTGLHAYYGKSHILHGVDAHIDEGEIVALLGRNGVGRSTMAKAILGMVKAEGSVRFRDEEILGRRTFEIAHAGHRLRAREPRHLSEPDRAPEPAAGREAQPAPVIAPLVGGRYVSNVPKAEGAREHLSRRAFGGEQQMLTLCRTLMGDPDLILIDEPTEGLAPMIVALVGDFLKTLKDSGVSVLLIEQKLTIALDISQRGVRDGPRPYRVRGHADRVEGEWAGEEGVAGGLRTIAARFLA